MDAVMQSLSDGYSVHHSNAGNSERVTSGLWNGRIHCGRLGIEMAYLFRSCASKYVLTWTTHMAVMLFIHSVGISTMSSIVHFLHCCSHYMCVESYGHQAQCHVTLADMKTSR